MSLIEIMERGPAPADGFDYSQLDPQVAADARQTAQRVREVHRRTMKAVLDMGRDLLTIKGKLGHGHFGPWLAAEFGGAARTAQNYMLAAERFADKSEIVAYLPPATVYKLAARSTPEPVRAELLSRLSSGERPDPDAIDAMVERAKS